MKQVYMRCVVLLVFLIPTLDLSAEPGDSARSVRPGRWYVPHYVPLQFAGNIGLLSLGAGYTSNHQNYQLSISYGYVPGTVAQTDIHTLTAKNNFPLMQYHVKNNETLIPYAGLGLTVEIGGITFFRSPSHFPDSYYDFPKNVHVIAYGGLRLQHLFRHDPFLLRGVEFYVEAGTIDAYLWYKTLSNQIKLREIFSLALGVNFLLNR